MLIQHQKEDFWTELGEWGTLVNVEAPDDGLLAQWAADPRLDLDTQGMAVLKFQESSCK